MREKIRNINLKKQRVNRRMNAQKKREKKNNLGIEEKYI